MPALEPALGPADCSSERSAFEPALWPAIRSAIRSAIKSAYQPDGSAFKSTQYSAYNAANLRTDVFPNETHYYKSRDACIAIFSWSYRDPIRCTSTRRFLDGCVVGDEKERF